MGGITIKDGEIRKKENQGYVFAFLLWNIKKRKRINSFQNL